MRVHVIFGSGRKDREPALTFPAALPRPARPWLGMLSSVAAHAAVIALLPVVADQVAQFYADDFSWASYRVESVRLRIPETIYYTPAKSVKAKVKPQPARPGGQAPRQNGGPDASLARFEIPVPTGLDLPTAPVSGRGKAVLLQPDSLPKAELRPVNVPPLAFWSRSAGEAPKPRGDEVTPGRDEQALTPPQLAAPPGRAVPNRDLALGAKNIAASAPVASAALPVAPSATAPVRDQSSDARNGALDQSAGQSAHVISLSAEPARPGQLVVVPPGSQGVGAHGAAPVGAGAAASTSQSADAQPKGSAGGTREVRTAGVAAQPQSTQAGRRSLEPAAQGSQLSQAPPSPQKAAARVAIAAPPPGRQTPPPTGGAEAFTRIMHPPNGTFDVVVTQSGSQAELPGVAAHLTGSPVYSVYLSVGDTREWVLAFCLPPKASKNSRYEVFVEDAAPLEPPYPIRTTIPKAVASQARAAAMVFHGFLTAAGTFRDMQPETSDAVAKQIASTLAEWQFRPARKNKLPTDIQVALIIPATADDRRYPSAAQGF